MYLLHTGTSTSTDAAGILLRQTCCSVGRNLFLCLGPFLRTNEHTLVDCSCMMLLLPFSIIIDDSSSELWSVTSCLLCLEDRALACPIIAVSNFIYACVCLWFYTVTLRVQENFC